MNEIEYAIEQLERRADAVSSIGEFEEYNALTTALAALRAELSRQENAPLTWNERINQMTVSEKADWMKDNDFCIVMKLPENGCFEFNSCTECLETWLNSPYTEGVTK